MAKILIDLVDMSDYASIGAEIKIGTENYLIDSVPLEDDDESNLDTIISYINNWKLQTKNTEFEIVLSGEINEEILELQGMIEFKREQIVIENEKTMKRCSD